MQLGLKKLFLKGLLNNFDDWIDLRNTDLYHNNIPSILSFYLFALQHAFIYMSMEFHKDVCLLDIAFQSISLSNRSICLEQSICFHQHFSILCLFFPKLGETSSYLLPYPVRKFQIISNSFCYSCSADWHKIRLVR